MRGTVIGHLVPNPASAWTLRQIVGRVAALAGVRRSEQLAVPTPTPPFALPAPSLKRGFSNCSERPQ